MFLKVGFFLLVMFFHGSGRAWDMEYGSLLVYILQDFPKHTLDGTLGLRIFGVVLCPI